MTELETPIDHALKAFWDAWPWLRNPVGSPTGWHDLPPEPMEAAIRAYESAVKNEPELGGEA